MAEVTRSIYFYKVEMADGQEWKRRDVLERLAALEGDEQLIALGEDNYAWAKVDRVPHGRESGRVRFFRDRRANLPGCSNNGSIEELPIPEEAGLIEPTHLVLAGDGLIAAEYNHFAPRIPRQFSALLRQRLGLNLQIGTLVQGDIVEQLDRLEEIQLLEFSLVATPELEQELRDAGPIGDAAVMLARADGGRRINMKLSGERMSPSWGEQARAFAKRLLSVPGQEHVTKVLRVTGYDPEAEGVEAVDLLRQRLARRVEIRQSTVRCKALDFSSAYQNIETAVAQVRGSDLPGAHVIY